MERRPNIHWGFNALSPLLSSQRQTSLYLSSSLYFSLLFISPFSSAAPLSQSKSQRSYKADKSLMICFPFLLNSSLYCSLNSLGSLPLQGLCIYCSHLLPDICMLPLSRPSRLYSDITSFSNSISKLLESISVYPFYQKKNGEREAKVKRVCSWDAFELMKVKQTESLERRQQNWDLK